MQNEFKNHKIWIGNIQNSHRVIQTCLVYTKCVPSTQNSNSLNCTPVWFLIRIFKLSLYEKKNFIKHDSTLNGLVYMKSKVHMYRTQLVERWPRCASPCVSGQAKGCRSVSWGLGIVRSDVLCICSLHRWLLKKSMVLYPDSYLSAFHSLLSAKQKSNWFHYR